jgi:predicted dehydrogenase
LLSNPADRDVFDVAHEIVAIGSSSSIEKCELFAKSIGAKNAKYYDNYEGLSFVSKLIIALVNDPNVDAIYVATPHSHHYGNVKLALNAGKHVLCEKPFTVNASQAEILADLAKQKKRFLLEAVWTRFFPLSIQVRQAISSGKLGEVHLVFADLSNQVDKDKLTLEHRLYNPKLAGGSLLDLGVYSLTWVMQTIYDAQKKRGEKPVVTGSLVPEKTTGVDEMSTVVLTWKDGNYLF